MSFGEDVSEEYVKNVTRRQTQGSKELKRDLVSAFWMKLKKNTCNDDLTNNTMEVPVHEHKLPKVLEAKERAGELNEVRHFRESSI